MRFERSLSAKFQLPERLTVDSRVTLRVSDDMWQSARQCKLVSTVLLCMSSRKETDTYIHTHTHTTKRMTGHDTAQCTANLASGARDQ